MKRNDLEQKIVKEGNRLVPHKINKIYERLGISFLDEKNDVSLEKQIKKEGETIMKNIRRPAIVSKADDWSIYCEKKISSEKASFVPDVKNKIGIKKTNPLLSFFKKPGFIAGFSTASVAIICSTVIIINNFNQLSSLVNSNTTTSSSTTNTIVELNGKSTINFKLSSASEKYKPEVVYLVDTNGYIDNSSIVSANDASENIINDFESENSNRKRLALDKQYTIPSFTDNYLKSALNLGYLERKDATKINKITLRISAGKEDEQYYVTLKENLEQAMNEFMYENKVIAEYEVIAETSEVQDDERTQLIRQAYEICTSLFVNGDGQVNKILCFSTDFNDWLVKYANYSLEDLQEYIDTLLYISNMISNDENKYEFIDSLADCLSMQTKIEELDDKYERLSDLYEDILDKLHGNGHNHDDDEDEDEFVKPDDEDGYEWDWWDDVGHNHHGGKPRNNKHYGGDSKDNFDPSDENYELFISELNTFLTNNSNIENKTNDELHSLCKNISYYSNIIWKYYDFYSKNVNQKMETILSLLDGGEYNTGKPEHDDVDNDCPPDWDDDFDDWWGHHHH